MAAPGASPPVVARERVTHASERGWSPLVEIADFMPLREAKEPGYRLTGGKFEFLGGEFCIEVYPAGYSAERKDCVGVFLRKLPPVDAVEKLEYYIEVTDADGEGLVEFGPFPAMFGPNNGAQTGPAFGKSRFIEEQQLPAVLQEGSLFVRGSVQALAEPVAVFSTGVEPSPPRLAADFGALLESGKGADVAFRVAAEGGVPGAEVAAHGLFLTSRSQVFDALLSGPLAMRGSSGVPIDGIRADVFRSVLHFAYTEQLPEEGREGYVGLETAEGAQHLLAAADRFGLERLRGLCEQRLCTALDVPSAAYTLTLAEQHGAGALKQAALHFMSRNMAAVLATPGWKHMLTSTPDLATELMARSVGLQSPPPVEAETGEGEEDGAQQGGRRVRQRGI